MKWFYHTAMILLLPFILHAEPAPDAIKSAPVRPVLEANVIVEEQEILETCEPEKICVQGRLANNGLKTAYQVKLRVEIGATKHGRPRATLPEKVETTTMAPGDRQEFALMIDRKITKKNAKGEEKTIEVGKYNFKIVPEWARQKSKAAAKPKNKR